MADKIQIPESKILVTGNGWVTYTDEGGTLRKAKASQVEVVKEGAAAPPEQVSDTATESDEGGPDSDTEQGDSPTQDAPDTDTPTPFDESPPSSDTPPAKPEASRPATKAKREKSMATPQTATKTKPAPAAKKAAPAKAAPKPAAKKKASNGDTSGVRTIGGKAVDLSEYTKTKAPGGGTSFHNGDPVAEKLAGKTLDEVYALAARTLKTEEKELRTKYKHLNVGMQRMSLGNRMRKILIPKAG